MIRGVEDNGGGALTGTQVRDALVEFRDLTYTSVMTIMGIMVDKGYVRRKKPGRSYLYSARIKQATTTRRMLLDLVERAYDGSVTSAVVNLLETSDIQPEELEQLRELIRQKTKQ